MKLSRDPYNCVGKWVLTELKEKGVTYAYACVNKVTIYMPWHRRVA